MRRILALIALVVGVWYLRKNWQRIWLQAGLQAVVSLLRVGVRRAPAMVGQMAMAARARVEDVRSRAMATAGTAAGMARGVGDVGVRKAEEGTSVAAQGVADAAANLQETSTTVADRAEQAARRSTGSAPQAAERATGIASEAAERATGIASEAAERATGIASIPIEPAAGGAPGPAEPAAGATAERATAPVPPNSIQTDVATPPPSVHETVQAGLADIGDKVRDLSALAAPEPAEQGAVRGEDAATTGTPGSGTMAAEGVTDVGGTREDEAAQEGIAPEGQRPRPVAGAGTTTPGGGAVRPLSPAGGEPTSTGVPEPLPPELSPGEPGTAGPAGSSRAPSRPDSAETPTTGMEQPPVVDRMAEVARRTSGRFIGNKATRRYHAATSGHLPAQRNRVYFETQEEAMAAGFEPAENEGLDGARS